MSKSKCSVQVRSSHGVSYTSRRGARRLVDRGLATPLSEFCIAMIESDHRFDSHSPAAHSPRLEIVARNTWSSTYRNMHLGLPNFVGIQRDRRSSISKSVA